MRRTYAAGLVAASLAVTLALTATPTVATSGGTGGPSAHAPRPDPDRGLATEALARARAALGGSADRDVRGGRARHERVDATIALRDLFLLRGRLDPDQRRLADAILARPTDGANDPFGYGYTVPAVKRCKGNFCLHWVTSTADAPPSNRWVGWNLKLMNKVWKKEVKKLGYRPPVSDRGRGGNDKFDVYLKDVSTGGLYGFCAPERRKPGFQWLASGFCVLDNDFVGFPRAPKESAEVTAAHEFFHAIQFGYDFGEDPWLLESTATWMEERVFDNVNDNRQYLPASQVAQPLTPLDYFSQTSSEQYGNWVFFEYLSEHFGNGIVQKIWNKAAALPGAPDFYSTKAITSALKPHGGFKKVYAGFASAAVLPAKLFQEGKNWGPTLIPPDRTASFTLTRAQRRISKRKALLHMSSVSYELRSSSSLKNQKWHLKVKIDGPKAFRAPAAVVLVAKKKGFERHLVKLNGKGNGQVVVPFGRKKVKAVYVSLVNASTRFKCGKRTQFTCSGLPIDDGRDFRGQPYRFRAVVIKR